MNKKKNRPSPQFSLKTLLIANRGEIASRIIRTCRKMGIKTIAIFSEADRNALYVEQADIAVFIGESSPSASYLNQEKIIAVAKKMRANAIHPGYGFLAENATFARKCEEEGILFIGPHPEAIEAMGSKANAKMLMQEHGVPVVPGYQEADQSVEVLTKAAEEIGYPVLLKATAGGGGKGMRVVSKKEELKGAIEAAKREAKNAFGDETLIIEKYIASGRHIEFQIFGDKYGHAIHILERECTIQRRYQKVVEESPSPVLDEALRAHMGEAAVKAAKALNYDNAGTVEFIFEEKTGEFYFLEVNTRLQVEHPVTEAITGLDLVQMQIEVAQGLPLALQQEEVKGNGYAIECRLYAEDAARNFMPVTGTIREFSIPEVDGLRLDSAIRTGSEISIFYDPMIAKLIVWDENRQGAHRKMQYTLRQLVCLGITTNQEFLLHLLGNPDFQAGNYDTHFISDQLDLNVLAQKKSGFIFAAIAACLYAWWEREQIRSLLRSIPSGWRNSFYDYQKENFLMGEEELVVNYRYQKESFRFLIEETAYAVQLIMVEEKQLRVEIDGIQYLFSIAIKENDYFVHNEQFGNYHLKQKDRFPQPEKEDIQGAYETPMPAQIIKVLVEEGQKVASGDALVILSSMKMENTITASEDGVVEAVFATAGENVAAGFLLLKIRSV